MIDQEEGERKKNKSSDGEAVMESGDKKKGE